MSTLGAGKHPWGPVDLASLPIVYLDAIARSGGLPVALPNEPDAIGQVLPAISGLLIMGGEDIDPKYYTKEPPSRHNVAYSEPRDRTEFNLVRLALRRNLPILGLCRGAQIINIAQRGSLHQHLLDGVTDFNHCQLLSDHPDEPTWHPVEFTPGSHLRQIFGKKTLTVNSDHHQGINTPGRHLAVTARAPDGVVEGIEGTKWPFVVGIQWHPERIYGIHPEQLKPFRALVREAKAFSAAERSPSVTG